MTVRKFRDSDRGSLIELWNVVFPDDPPHNEPSIMIDAKLAVDDLIFVKESNGSLVGACMAGYDGHRGWLYAVAVLTEYRRNGTGEALIRYAMQSLKEKGCIKVNLQIRASNAKVQRFYQALGFETEDRISMGAFIK